MALSDITIANRIEIQPGPRQEIIIPGCEPISSLSSPRMAQEMKCNSSRISVKDALSIIPGSKVVRVFIAPGHVGTGLFFEFPSGPPPNGGFCGCITDWYKILREFIPGAVPKLPAGCSGFNFSGCERDPDPFKAPRDPEARPNSNPLNEALFNPFGYS